MRPSQAIKWSVAGPSYFLLRPRLIKAVVESDHCTQSATEILDDIRWCRLSRKGALQVAVSNRFRERWEFSGNFLRETLRIPVRENHTRGCAKYWMWIIHGLGLQVLWIPGIEPSLSNHMSFQVGIELPEDFLYAWMFCHDVGTRVGGTSRI